MIKNIQNEFMNILKGIDWMDNESKKNALEKVFLCLNQKRNFMIANFSFETKAQLIDIKIGYPDFTYNDTYIDSLYEDVRMMKK